MAAKRSLDNSNAFPRPLIGTAFRWSPRMLLLAALGVGILTGGTYAVWLAIREQVGAGPQYLVPLDNLWLTPPPDWIHSDVKVEVLRDAGLDGPLSILDEDLAERIHRGFALHAWIAKVERVSKHPPARVEVHVVYRRPVCMVEVPGGLFPVDAEGVLLPTGDFSAVEASRYPRLAGIQPTTTGPVGTPWRDPRVAGAARIAAALTGDWQALELLRIVPLAGTARSPGGETEYEIVTKNSSRIAWGAAPGEQDSQGVADKVARLRKYFAEHGGWKGPQRSLELDLRHGSELVPPARTATRP